MNDILDSSDAMKAVDYNSVLTEEDRIRIAFKQNRGKITFFIVQYYSLINSRWRSIMRIDTCHGHAHKHTYHLKHKEYLVSLSKGSDSLNTIFTEAINHIRKDFSKIKQNFLNN